MCLKQKDTFNANIFSKHEYEARKKPSAEPKVGRRASWGVCGEIGKKPIEHIVCQKLCCTSSQRATALCRCMCETRSRLRRFPLTQCFSVFLSHFYPLPTPFSISPKTPRRPYPPSSCTFVSAN